MPGCLRHRDSHHMQVAGILDSLRKEKEASACVSLIVTGEEARSLHETWFEEGCQYLQSAGRNGLTSS